MFGVGADQISFTCPVGDLEQAEHHAQETRRLVEGQNGLIAHRCSVNPWWAEVELFAGLAS